MIRVACPKCGRTYRTRTEGMGKTAVCSKCHTAFKIGEVRLPFQWQASDLGEDSWVGVPAPREKKELKTCIMCDAPLNEGEVRCPECGVNQVTGLATPKRIVAESEKRSFFKAIPLRMILVAVVIGGVLFAGYLASQWIGQSVSESTEQAHYQGIVRRATEHLTKPNGQATFVREFAGTVTDDNLPAFIRMLSADNPEVRRAAMLLIGCGQITDLQPILDLENRQAAPVGVQEVLFEIGERKLVQLSCDSNEQVRTAAAGALCLVSNLEAETETIKELAGTGSIDQKTTLLNSLCRPWPEATGTFAVIIDEKRSPFLVHVEQIGQRFFLDVEQTEFRSAPRREREFQIPLVQWCAATEAAIDIEALSQMLAGTLNLQSPLGASWQGMIQVIVKQRLRPPLPGFLPVEPPGPGVPTEVSIRLERGG